MKGIRKFLILTLSLFMMLSSCLMISAEDEKLIISANQNDNGDLVVNISGTDANDFIEAITSKETNDYIGLNIGTYYGHVRGDVVRVGDGFVTVSKEDLIKGGFVSGEYTVRCIAPSNGQIFETKVTLSLDNTVTPNQLQTLNLNQTVKTPVVGEAISYDDSYVNIVDEDGNAVSGVSARWTKSETYCSLLNEDGSCKEYSTYYRPGEEDTFKEGETYYYTVDYYYIMPMDKELETSLTADGLEFTNVGEKASKGVSGISDCELTTWGLQSFVAAFTPTKVVAKIGNTAYASLQEAINKASSGQTIVLQDDITVDTLTISGEKTITLNMNGKTITQDYSGFTKYKCLINVLNGANLTITGNGKFVGPAEDGAKFDAAPLVMAEGEKTKLTILNGTFTAGGNYDCGMYGVYSKNGGTIILGDKNTKTGPTIHTYFAAIGENNTTSPSYVTVYGGEYTADVAPTSNESWYYFCAPIYASATGEINIYGGTFKGYYGISSCYSNVNQTINISGGTFNATKDTLLVENRNGKPEETISRIISISGGVFSSDVTKYLAEGSDIAKVGTKYAVSKKSDKLPEVEVDVITPTVEEKATKETLKEATVKNSDGNVIEDIASKEIELKSTSKTEDDIKEVKETIKEEVIKKVTEESKKVESNSVGLIPLDVTLNIVTKTSGGEVEKTEKVAELSKPITVTLYLNKDTLDKIEGKIVKVVRIHDDETTVLDANLENNALSFKTNKFSTYVIAYAETKASPTKSYSSKDKNQDGVISCEEEMDSANWIWSTTKNACVYKVSNTGVR